MARRLGFGSLAAHRAFALQVTSRDVLIFQLSEKGTKANGC